MEHEITERTLDFIAQWEGFRSGAYWDATGGKWTVGYGHTRQVTKDTTCTKARAREWMRADCAATARHLNSPGMDITQWQFDALVSFAYNAGLGNLKRSTLLKLVRHSAPVELVAAEFRKWVRSGGVVLDGLVLRREAEAMLYATGKDATREDALVHIEKRLGRDWKKKVRGGSEKTGMPANTPPPKARRTSYALPPFPSCTLLEAIRLCLLSRRCNHGSIAVEAEARAGLQRKTPARDRGESLDGADGADGLLRLFGP